MQDMEPVVGKAKARTQLVAPMVMCTNLRTLGVREDMVEAHPIQNVTTLTLRIMRLLCNTLVGLEGELLNFWLWRK